MSAWVNDPDFPEAGDGVDLVISQNRADRKLKIPGLKPPSTDAKHQWVTTTFGEYFFQPSIEALGHLAAG